MPTSVNLAWTMTMTMLKVQVLLKPKLLNLNGKDVPKVSAIKILSQNSIL